MLEGWWQAEDELRIKHVWGKAGGWGTDRGCERLPDVTRWVLSAVVKQMWLYKRVGLKEDMD